MENSTMHQITVNRAGLPWNDVSKMRCTFFCGYSHSTVIFTTTKFISSLMIYGEFHISERFIRCPSNSLAID